MQTETIEKQFDKYFKNPLVTREDGHQDERGVILPLTDETLRSAVLIDSKKGSVRANNYHKTDWHFCYVTRGKIDYYWRKVNSKQKPLHIRIEAGQNFFTPPMVEHAMVFAEDTTFVCLGRNPRDQKSYEADIVRVEVYPFEN